MISAVPNLTGINDERSSQWHGSHPNACPNLVSLNLTCCLSELADVYAFFCKLSSRSLDDQVAAFGELHLLAKCNVDDDRIWIAGADAVCLQKSTLTH